MFYVQTIPMNHLAFTAFVPGRPPLVGLPVCASLTERFTKAPFSTSVGKEIQVFILP